MFNFFKRGKKNKVIQKSLDKYLETLDNDRDLMLCIHQGNSRHKVYIDLLTREEVIFIVPVGNRAINRIREDQIINVDFITKKGVYLTKVRVTKKDFREDNIYYTGEIADEIERQQRRGSARLEVEVNVTVIVDDVYEGKTKNLSATGMLLESEAEFKDDQHVSLVFDVNEKIYRPKASIIKARKYASGRQHLYHIHFDDIKQGEVEELSKFIFNAEIDQLAREANIRR
ncbi:MAG: PilZ domain-containing protein [Peptostreptococcaceae bacterium]